MKSSPVVFVVDDDPAARESVAALVSSKGVASETFASTEEFLDRFDRSKSGCLVVDAWAAGRGGLELQELLRAEGVCLEVIMVAERASIPMAVRAIRNGAVTFLEKPYSNGELWKNIAQAIGGSRRPAVLTQKNAG